MEFSFGFILHLAVLVALPSHPPVSAANSLNLPQEPPETPPARTPQTLTWKERDRALQLNLKKRSSSQPPPAPTTSTDLDQHKFAGATTKRTTGRKVQFSVPDPYRFQSICIRTNAAKTLNFPLKSSEAEPKDPGRKTLPLFTKKKTITVRKNSEQTSPHRPYGKMLFTESPSHTPQASPPMQPGLPPTPSSPPPAQPASPLFPTDHIAPTPTPQPASPLFPTDHIPPTPITSLAPKTFEKRLDDHLSNAEKDTLPELLEYDLVLISYFDPNYNILGEEVYKKYCQFLVVGLKHHFIYHEYLTDVLHALNVELKKHRKSARSAFRLLMLAIDYTYLCYFAMPSEDFPPIHSLIRFSAKMSLTLDSAYINDASAREIQLKIERLAAAYHNKLWKPVLTLPELNVMSFAMMRIRDVVLQALHEPDCQGIIKFAKKIPQIKITVELLLIALSRRNIDQQPLDEFMLEVQCAYMNIVLLFAQTEFMLRKFDVQPERNRLAIDPKSVIHTFLTYLQGKMNHLLTLIIETNYLKNVRKQFNDLFLARNKQKTLADKTLIFPDAYELTEEGEFMPTFTRVEEYVLPWSEAAIISSPIQRQRRQSIG